MGSQSTLGTNLQRGMESRPRQGLFSVDEAVTHPPLLPITPL